MVVTHDELSRPEPPAGASLVHHDYRPAELPDHRRRRPNLLRLSADEDDATGRVLVLRIPLERLSSPARGVDVRP